VKTGDRASTAAPESQRLTARAARKGMGTGQRALECTPRDPAVSVIRYAG
jgi:hypothetical protein